MTDWIKWTDRLGPEKIVHVYDAKTGMKGVVVVDTTTMGLAGGGTRMMPDITTGEIYGLARAMTHKFAILDFPVGGAKAGIWADPGIRGEERKSMMMAFGKAVQPILANGVTLAADIGTDAEDVALFYEGAGLPSGSTGLALHEIDGEPLENHATGYGVVVSAKAACDVAGLDIRGATAAIEGFGKVGGGVARYLQEEGAVVCAISTLKGTLYDPDGLDVEKLLQLRIDTGDEIVSNYDGGKVLPKEDIYTLPVDILIPGARTYVIDKANVGNVQAKVISSIANIPITAEAEEILFQRKIYAPPDFISNAGGVVVGVLDILGGTADDVFRILDDFLGRLTREILVEAFDCGKNPREFAVEKTTQKVLAARASGVVPPFEEILASLKEQLNL
jgi:glutamate dehydrogenase (NAD(P)+)